MGATNRVELKVGADTRSAQAVMARFGEWLKGGFGMAVADRITSAFQRIPQAIQQAIETGIRFNSTIEDAQLGMAGLLRAIAPERFGTLEDALSASSVLMRELRKEAETTAATFGQLVEATQGLMGPALSAGIPIDRVAKLASMIARTVGTVMPGAPGYQIMQEGRALLTGDIGPAAFVAKSIPGITKQGIDDATKAGRLFEYLEDKLGAFNEAAARGAETFTVLASNLKDAFEGVTADATTPLFTDLKTFLKDLRALVQSAEFQQALKVISNAASIAVKAATPAARQGLSGVSMFAEVLRLGGGLQTAVITSAYAAASSEVRAMGPAIGEAIASQLRPSPSEARSTMHWGAVGWTPSAPPNAGARPIPQNTISDLMKGRGIGGPQSSLSSSGLFLTRAEAYMQRRGIELQRTMVDELRRIRELLTGKGITLEW